MFEVSTNGLFILNIYINTTWYYVILKQVSTDESMLRQPAI